MANLASLIRPSLFGWDVQKQPLKVFICGPGNESVGIGLRKRVQSHISSFRNCETLFGEELTSKLIAVRRADLQTLESQLAQSVDFTILLLDSPGAIAELGTFSMVPSIRSRLFVLVPSRYFRAKSYIDRGPLSLISKDFKRHVIYFDGEHDFAIWKALDFIVSLYKYARYRGGRDYLNAALNDWRRPAYKSESYEKYFQAIRREFFKVAIFSVILTLDDPTFSEIVDASRMHPDEVSAALAELHAARKITKSGKARYGTTEGFHDGLLASVDTVQLSRAKATYVALS
jgi:hypothetical protein